MRLFALLGATLLLSACDIAGVGDLNSLNDIHSTVNATEVSRTVTFDKNSPDATGAMGKQTINIGASAALTKNGFSLPGYDFSGWATTADGAKKYSDEASFAMGPKDVTLYAVWEKPSANAAKDITTLSFSQPTGTTVAFVGTAIGVTVPYATDITALIPTIETTGASVSPTSGSSTNFASPVDYTVTAADGSTKVYTVTVTVAPNTENKITSFSFPVAETGLGSVAVGTINHSAHTITVNVPFGTTIGSWKADFSASADATVKVGAATQTTGVTTNNFATSATTAVVYTVTAASGAVATYEVKVVAALSSSKSIETFTINGVDGTVDLAAKTVTVTLPFAVSRLFNPTISISGSTISPQSGGQVNFANPVTYTVTAADGSTQAWIVTVNMTPPVPATPTLSAVGTDRATVNWAAVSGATGYDVYYSTGAAAPTLFQTVAGATLSLPVTGLSPNTGYSFVVRSVNAFGSSANSISATATTLPLAPSALTVDSATDTQVNLSWTAPSGGATGYKVYWQAGSSTSKAGSQVGVVVTGTTATVSGLSGGTGYAFVAVATGAGGDSTETTPVTKTTLPSAPAIGTPLPGSGQVTVGWSTVTGATGYTVYYGTSSTFTSPPSGSNVSVLGQTSSSTVVSSLANGTKYYFLVVANSGAGNSVPSSIVSTTLAPPSPAVLNATVGDQQVNLTWSASAGATSYNLYWATTSGVTTNTGTKLTGVTSPYVHTGRVNGTPYYYVVTAENAGGESTASTQVAMTPRSSVSDITSFSITAQNNVVISAGSIAVTVPYGTNLSSLGPTIGVSAGATVSPTSATLRNFANSATTPVVYTVTAADGITTKSYDVTVTVAPQPTLNSFTLVGGTTTKSGMTFQVDLPANTALTSLVPTFTASANAIVKIGADVQTSGVSSVPTFASSVTYTVTDTYGSPATTYTVNVTTPSTVSMTKPEVVTVTLTGGPNVTITWTGTGSDRMGSAGTLTVSGNTGYSVTATHGGSTAPTFVGWFKNGDTTRMETSTTLNIGNASFPGTTQSPAQYTVMAVYSLNGNLYSATVAFTTN